MTPDRLREQPSSASEISDLWERYRLALSDAQVRQQSVDGRYVDAYSAGFLLAKIAVRASGYRVAGSDNHRDTIAALPWLLGSGVQPTADSLEAARRRRNASMYDAAETVSERDLHALLDRVAALETLVRDWIAERHSEFAPW